MFIFNFKFYTSNCNLFVIFFIFYREGSKCLSIATTQALFFFPFIVSDITLPALPPV